MGFIDDLKRLARPYEDEEEMDDYEDDFGGDSRNEFSERSASPCPEGERFVQHGA